jgi:signal transduction histidine kinase/ligand-binding sensor domain-containing protein
MRIMVRVLNSMSFMGRKSLAALPAAALICGLLLVGSSKVSMALEPTTPLANYNRQGWAMENGLPQNTVQALAQTTDGFLWLGTEVGLVRFDGNGFAVLDTNSQPKLPGSDVQCLLATRDGALWVGTSDGLARLANGDVQTFTTRTGLPGDDIRALKEEPDETILVTTENGTVEVSRTPTPNGETSVPKPPEGFHAGLGGGVRAVGTNNTVTLMNGGATVQQWSAGKELPGSRVQALYADREGALWIGTNGGLVRYAGGKLEQMPVTDPLGSASVLAIMEDREGDLWVGTETNGLQILRDQRFHTIGTHEGLASDNTTTVVQDGAGTFWVGTSGSGVTALRPGAGSATGIAGLPSATFTVKNGLASDVILSLAAANGDVWVGTPDGLSRIRGGSIVTFTSADGLPDDFIRSLLEDADGSLWIGTRHGLTHWSKPGDTTPGTMRTYTQDDGLGNDLVGAMARDTTGDLWVATFAGLSRLHGAKFENYTTANGLSSNVITSLLAREHGSLLVGTQDHGWNLWDGMRFEVVKNPQLAHTTVHAILDDGLHHLWFATATGLARCDCANNGMMDSADCSHWLEFSTADGLRSRETATNSHPSAWKAQDGTLWFATPKGVVEIDPAHFPVNTVPPPVVVERFAVDDVAQALPAANAPLTIPAGHNHFAFDYAALSFVAPQKVHYRFKLEGFDHEWTDAGTRRTAYYTNIPPGHYTFRVQAENNDGVWNTSGAALQVTLQPHFYQTIWFYVLLALGVLGLVFLALKLRLLRAEREFKAVLGERTRIAREIHDTLAQGYVGISVQLEVLSELLKHNRLDAAEQHLNRTREIVRDGLADARQSIWALRSQDSAETTLPVELRRIVEHAGGHGLEATFSTYGAYRPLPPGSEREIVRIAQEAIHNVKKHAGAKHLNVQLAYTPGEIAVEVRDDGQGIARTSEAGEIDSPPGHFGLTGMRERAAALGGKLEISSEPGAGTTVRLRAPAAKGFGSSEQAVERTEPEKQAKE